MLNILRSQRLVQRSRFLGFGRCLRPPINQRKLTRSFQFHQHVHTKFGRATFSTKVDQLPPKDEAISQPDTYRGPLDGVYRKLKIFSLSSLAISCAFAPLIFVLEASMPLAPRVALASIILVTSGGSTALISWCGSPYVSTLRKLTPAKDGELEGLEMTTNTLFLRPLITRVYDPSFLVNTKRPMAKWELAESLALPSSTDAKVGLEETIAETINGKGDVIGRWIVKWGEKGQGTCYGTGKVAR